VPTDKPCTLADGRPRRRTLAAAATLIASTLVTACTSSPAPEPERGPARPEVQLGFTQILPEEGSRHALLRVVNPGSRSLDVTAVGITWEGYGDVLQPTDGHKEIPAGDQLMLRLELPPPRCDVAASRPEEEVRGRLTVDGVDVEQALTSPAQRYVRRLWRTQCDRLLLDRTIALEWRLAEGPAEEGRVATELLLTRRDGTDRVTVLATDGSVLYRLSTPRGAALASGAASGTVPLDVLPGNRCDEHAIGQATAPYDFSITLEVGSRRVRHALSPPLSIQNAASRMLLQHCGAEPERG
jgi:hypothetical protein